MKAGKNGRLADGVDGVVYLRNISENLGRETSLRGAMVFSFVCPTGFRSAVFVG